MPEGDTIHELAAEIGRRLVGRRLSVGSLREAPAVDLAGRTVEAVRAHGKHLLVGLDDSTVLRSHLGMHGSWHRYRPGETWQRPRHRASILLATEDDVLVCFDAREVVLRSARGRLDRGCDLAHLGPDLVSAAPDGEQVVRRARALLAPETPLADILLDQRVAAGIGNLYKSEILFLHGLHPERRLDATDDDRLAALYATAHQLLRRNLGGGLRTTRSEADGRGRLWVYGRGRAPCLRCGATVVSARLGRGLRATCWCPACQPARGVGADAPGGRR